MLAVPNFSASDAGTVAALQRALAGHARILDVHSDAVHGRSVFTLAGEPDELRVALVAGANAAIEAIDMSSYAGAHPAIGALDVAPIVWLDERERDAAALAARGLADEIAARGIPVFLYGERARSSERRERAYFRRGGLAELTRRMQSGELQPDLGPPAPHPTAGATLVTSRPPLAAFNLVVEGLGEKASRDVAGRVREAGGGPAGVRAMAIDLGGGRRQISTNVHDPLNLRLGAVAELVQSLATEAGGTVSGAEIVGLVPEAAMDSFPADLPIPGFDPARQVIERRLSGS